MIEVNRNYVFTLYNKVKTGCKEAKNELVEYYLTLNPNNYYETFDVDDDNLERIFTTLYN